MLRKGIEEIVMLRKGIEEIVMLRKCIEEMAMLRKGSQATVGETECILERNSVEGAT